MTRTLTLVALLATSAPLTAVAQSPFFSVDVQRTSGIPQLNADGNWVWEVTLTNGASPSAATVLFGAEFGADFAGASLISGTVPLTGLGNGGVETATPAPPIFGWEDTGGGFGGLFAEGFQLDPSQGANGQAFFSHGTAPLTPEATLLMATFVTQGPSTEGPLTSSLSLVAGEVAQTTGIVGNLTAFGSITAIVGDANLDGIVDAADQSLVSSNLGLTTSAGWLDGDLNGSGVVDGDDLALVTTNLAIPEPGTLSLSGAMALLVARRRR